MKIQKQLVPVSDYLSEKELALYYLNEDTLDLGDRIEAWWIQSVFQAFFHDMETAIQKANQPELTTALLASRKDTLINILKNNDILEEELPLYVQGAFETPAVKWIAGDIEKSLWIIQRKNEYLINLNGDYTNQVTMPGLILDTNADALEGSTVTWEFDPNHFVWEDHIMWVESRIVNRWAMIVTGVVCILLIAGLILGPVLLRKRREIRTA
ncbi:hypothetical protein JW835_01305 [bacterium]|nr:hypothetical protein [bacterium]